jgi:hypothetical protein
VRGELQHQRLGQRQWLHRQRDHHGWTLAWTFPGNQQIDQMWNAAYTQTGQSASARDAGYNATINPGGGSQSFGFNGSFSGTNAEPVAFALNGTACAVVP